MKTLEVLEKYLRVRRLRPDTVRQYTEVFESLAEFSDEWPISSVVVDEWVASLVLADTTIKQYFNVGNLLGRYMSREYKLENPFEKASRPKVTKKRRRIFSGEELVRIINACMNEQETALVAVLIDSGCRIGELVGLRVDDVRDGWLYVKGKTGERRYRLSLELCEKLREMGSDGEAIFRMVDGSSGTVAAINNRVRRIVRRAGVKGNKIGPHTFRHTSGSMVARATGSVLAVKALLQHDDVATSMVYIHEVEGDMAQGISPLALLGEEVAKSRAESGEVGVPMLLEGGVDDDVVDGEFIEQDTSVEDGLVLGMFPEIKDGVSIRPLLKTEDLRLLRSIFVRYGAMVPDSGEIMKVSHLMRRILRRSSV